MGSGSLLKCVFEGVSARTDLTKCWRESKYCSLPRYSAWRAREGFPAKETAQCGKRNKTTFLLKLTQTQFTIRGVVYCTDGGGYGCSAPLRLEKPLEIFLIRLWQQMLSLFTISLLRVLLSFQGHKYIWFQNLYMDMNISKYVNVCLYKDINVCLSKDTNVCLSKDTNHIYLKTWMYVCLRKWMYFCLRTWMYVCLRT